MFSIRSIYVLGQLTVRAIYSFHRLAPALASFCTDNLLERLPVLHEHAHQAFPWGFERSRNSARKTHKIPHRLVESGCNHLHHADSTSDLFLAIFVSYLSETVRKRKTTKVVSPSWL